MFVNVHFCSVCRVTYPDERNGAPVKGISAESICVAARITSQRTFE